METWTASVRGRARAEAEKLLDSISAAETVIVTTIERECEALRARRLLAARALHIRLCDAAHLYVQTAKATRASLGAIEEALPGSYDFLEERRNAFSALLRVELSVLASERAEAGEPAREYFRPRRAAPAPQGRVEARAVRMVSRQGENAAEPGPRPPMLRRGGR